jgi:hypothetical protein
MANEVMQSLFGLTPGSVQQQIRKEQEDRARMFASRSQTPMAAYYAGRAIESGLGTPLFESQQDPRITKAQSLQSIIQRVKQYTDLSTPEGLTELAKELNIEPEFTGMALALRQEAAKMQQEKEKRGLETELTKTRIEREKAGIAETEARTRKTGLEADREENLRIALAELPPNATDEQLLAVYRKFGTADQQARAIQASIDRKARLAGQGEGTGAGYIGKGGAYRNQFGDVIAGSEMKKQRENFLASQKLLENLNRITEVDVKDAEATFDYTSSDSSKAIGSKLYPKTISAQTRIAASQLLQQLESLPPGSASDADIKLAAKNFPGYGNAANLARWINDTKSLISSSLERQVELYGFPLRVTPTAPLDIGKKKGTQPQTQTAPAAGGAPRATKRYNRQTNEVEDI